MIYTRTLNQCDTPADPPEQLSVRLSNHKNPAVKLKGFVFGIFHSHTNKMHTRDVKQDFARVTDEPPRSAWVYETQEAPSFFPSDEEFENLSEYIKKIRPDAENFGMCKIIAPASWKPPTRNPQKLEFQTRIMILHETDGINRERQAYIDGLCRFHAQRGTEIVYSHDDQSLLQLYDLKQWVSSLGDNDDAFWTADARKTYNIWIRPYEMFRRECELFVAQAVQDCKGSDLRQTPPHVQLGSHNLRKRPRRSERLEQDPKKEETGEVQPCSRRELRQRTETRTHSPNVHCKHCKAGFDQDCLPKVARHSLPSVSHPGPDRPWYCPTCLVGIDEYGFGRGALTSFTTFAHKAHNFAKEEFRALFESHQKITKEMYEARFWQHVHNPNEEVRVHYGADIPLSKQTGATRGKQHDSRSPDAEDMWSSLRRLGCLLTSLPTEIEGVTKPWLYVGMCFAAFCWHTEDHDMYSANYHHYGSTKTWYGVPGSDSSKFEEVVQQSMPTLSKFQGNFLSHMNTMINPGRLIASGVRVYTLDQGPRELIITFPKAYHAGFNHGVNLNEAVNFAPADWEPHGRASVERMRQQKIMPCFSHDQLVFAAAQRRHPIQDLESLSRALKMIIDREVNERSNFYQEYTQDALRNRHPCNAIKHIARDRSIDTCDHCKAYSYLSSVHCGLSNKLMCLLHATQRKCCLEKPSGDLKHTLQYRYTDDELREILSKVVCRAESGRLWQNEYDKYIHGERKLTLEHLRMLLHQGKAHSDVLEGLSDLQSRVLECDDWIREASRYIITSQSSLTSTPDRADRSLDHLHVLLSRAISLKFDCPELDKLSELSRAIANFQQDAKKALLNDKSSNWRDLESLIARGIALDLLIPEIAKLNSAIRERKQRQTMIGYILNGCGR